jgi:hypothetical protein
MSDYIELPIIQVIEKYSNLKEKIMRKNLQKYFLIFENI